MIPAGNRTHDLAVMSRLPKPLDQGANIVKTKQYQSRTNLDRAKFILSFYTNSKIVLVRIDELQQGSARVTVDHSRLRGPWFESCHSTVDGYPTLSDFK